MEPATPEAFDLMRDGAIALAQVEAAGIRIDVPYLDRTIEETKHRIDHLGRRLREQPEYGIIRKRFGDGASLVSRDQLAYLFYDVQGHAPLSQTSSRGQVDEEALLHIGTPYARNTIRYLKLSKLYDTYLTGVRRETANDGRLHAFYNLHLAVSYRSTSDSVNFQNQPIRDKMMGALIRRAFVSSGPDYLLAEMDLKANEVRVACCYSKDEKLIFDTLHGDMHRDMAAECFMMPKGDVPGPLRNLAKGNFVFAEFFGSYYPDVARSLWEESVELTTKAGGSIHGWLAGKGITGRGECTAGRKRETVKGTFEHHIKEIEKQFWGVRYRQYDEWRQKQWSQYLENGYFRTLTGFVCAWGKGGLMGKNMTMNYPIQGSAFHCLLWALIRLVRWLKKNKMRSKVVGQVHDSLILDCHKDELAEVIGKARQLLVEEIRKSWAWLIVPLGVECAVGPNWWDKEEYKIA